MRFWLKRLATLAGMLALVTAVGVREAKASPIPFATLQSIPGVPTIVLDLTTFGLSTIDVANPLDSSDPLNPAAVISYTQLSPAVGPLPALMKMAPVAPAGVIDATHTLYGPGSFVVGIVGATNSIPWLFGSFSSAVLNLSPSLDGSFSNLDGTTLSGAGLNISGLGNPGSFAFALGNPQFVLDGTGAQTGVSFEVTSGAVFAEPVPEPASLLLFGFGALFALVALKRRPLALAIEDRRS